MKNRKIIEIIGSTILIASLGVTGCSVRAAELSPTDETEETTEEVEVIEETEEEYICGCDMDIDDEDYQGCYCSYNFESTNGELEGQLDYMELCPDIDSIDWDHYPENPYITDPAEFEDADIRAIAQEYMNDGYQIYDPEIDLSYGVSLGDGEYQFNNGFNAYRDEGEAATNVFVYKMNETLFEYFLVDMSMYENADRTDDGTTIRVGDDDYYVEYNRDTGIGICHFHFGDEEAVG